MRSQTAKAVIGAGYGDEGKGLLTDYISATETDAIVVRSNGGAQAGHTVVAPDGRRHVFHHVGSGTFAGAPTHLSRFFVAHPMMLLGELQALGSLSARPVISSDPRTVVTTPFDMMINQALELSRGDGRHGSCGLGFGEAIERSLRPDFLIRTGDLFHPGLARKLWRVWSQWLPERLAQLGLEGLPASILDAIDPGEVIARFMLDCEAYLDHVALFADRRLGAKGQVVFEGAQGLMLDQDFGAFPHVTRSNTGLRNMLEIVHEADIAAIDAIYVTRCYATRHGAGPLPGAINRISGIEVDDPTNVANRWQGTMRIAPLDTALLRTAISRDLAAAEKTAIGVRASLAVTCLDQAVGEFHIVDGDVETRVGSGNAAREIADRVGMALFGESRGASRSTFQCARARKIGQAAA